MGMSGALALSGAWPEGGNCWGATGRHFNALACLCVYLWPPSVQDVPFFYVLPMPIAVLECRKGMIECFARN